MQQALERAGIKNNLGWSYGLEALEMGSLMKALLIAEGHLGGAYFLGREGHNLTTDLRM